MAIRRRAVEKARTRLESATSRSDALAAVNDLAPLAARGDRAALNLVLAAVLEHRLAEQPIRSVLLDRADIDDAMQGTLIAIAENIATFEGRSGFHTWVNSIARNEALMIIRRRQRKSEPSGQPLPEVDHSARRLSSLLADQQTIAAALGRLSEEHRHVLHLREDLGLSYEEIAEQLALKVGTVRSRINRARGILAEILLHQRSEGAQP